MKRVLIVSPHFPPINAPDHQRVRMSLPYFREHDWEPVVLAVEAGAVEGVMDPLLAETIPADIAIHRVPALPARVTRLLGLGNIGYRAWFQLRDRGAALLAREKFDLVYFSTTQFVVTALGRKWRRRFGVPYVVDIQDPWRTDYYERPGAPPPPGGWKYRFARWQAARLEERSWREASGFVSVNERYLSDLRARYPWFAARPSAVIPFGVAENDLALARSQADLAPAFRREAGMMHLVSVGAVGTIMRGALERLFAGMQALRAADPAGAQKLRFHFIGTSYARAGHATESVRPVAANFGVSDLVEEVTTRVGYFVALKTMLAADALIIPGSNDPGYRPSKLASCVLAGKPTLALGPTDSVFAQAVRESGFAQFAAAPGTDNAVETFLSSLLAGKGVPPSRDPSLFLAEHSARVRTREQCELWERALRAS